MKKRIAAILALCLCMGTASADGLGSWLRGLWESAAGSDEAAEREESEFDRLFDSGLTPVLEKEYIDVSQVPVYVSAEYARDNAESLGISPDSITDGLVFVANAGDVAGEDAKFFTGDGDYKIENSSLIIDDVPTSVPVKKFVFKIDGENIIDENANKLEMVKKNKPSVEPPFNHFNS